MRYVPDYFRTQEMCERAVEKGSWSLVHVSDQYKTQEMCNKAVKKYPWLLEYVPNNFKKPKMKAVKKNPHRLSKKRRTQKASIKEELMPIAWLPSRWWDWCVPEDEKDRKIVGINTGFLCLMTRYKKIFDHKI